MTSFWNHSLVQNRQTGYKSQRSTTWMFFIYETCCSSFSMIVQQISAIEPPRCLDRKMLYRLVQTDNSSTLLSHWLRKWRQVTCVTRLHSFMYTGTVFVWQHDYGKKVSLQRWQPFCSSSSSSVSWGLGFANGTNSDQWEAAEKLVMAWTWLSVWNGNALSSNMQYDTEYFNTEPVYLQKIVIFAQLIFTQTCWA